MHTVTKQYRDLPAAHRQPNHNGHCRLIHGHNWGWDITFACRALDANGFVIDVGQLHVVKQFLVNHFDHTLLLNSDDPLLTQVPWEAMGGMCIAKVVDVPNCGMEGLAEFVFKQINTLIKTTTAFPIDVTRRQVEVVRVVCWEDSKNSATYEER